MAGQPQDPSWQPGGPDQAREAWPPPPSFTPQTKQAQQDTFIYPQPPTYGQPSQPGPGSPGPGSPAGQGYPPPTYTPQDQAYSPPDQAYTPPDQAYSPRDQSYTPPGQAYVPPDQPYSPPGMPQWQASPGKAAAAPRSRGEKGFIGSLFDFSFKSMVTPKIIKVLYVLIVAWVALLALVFLVIAFQTGGALGGIAVLIIVDPILILLSLGAYRVILELCMVIFRLHEDVKAIRDRGDGQI